MKEGQFLRIFEKQGKYNLLKGLVLREFYPQSINAPDEAITIFFMKFPAGDDLLRIMRRHGYYLDGAVAFRMI
jgi:hypothetical protein